MLSDNLDIWNPLFISGSDSVVFSLAFNHCALFFSVFRFLNMNSYIRTLFVGILWTLGWRWLSLGRIYICFCQMPGGIFSLEFLDPGFFVFCFWTTQLVWIWAASSPVGQLVIINSQWSLFLPLFQML